MSLDTAELERAAPAKPARRGFAVALTWGLTGAFFAAASWVVPLLILSATHLLGPTVSRLGGQALETTLTCGGLAACIGFVVGAVAGLSRSGAERGPAAVALGSVGALTGVIGGGLCVPAVLAFGSLVHPLVSSALPWALAGLVSGLIGRAWSVWLHPPAPREEEAKASEAPSPPRVEWLLRQPEQRRLRDWPLFRVLPVLVVSAVLLVGAAALAPRDAAVALAGAGAVGLAAALVLHAQEGRVRRLEAHLRVLERQLREDRG